jgi:hypothetical protein
MVESLSRKLESEIRVGNFPGIKVVRGVKRIDNLQLVDETLLLGGVSIIISSNFKMVIDPFIIICGGTINYNKRQIYG